MTRIARLLPILALGLSACGAGGGPETTAVVRDSAGITIVENRGPVWAAGEGWRVSGTPVVDIGMLQGPPEYQLFRVNDAARLSDGRLVVANAGTGELRYYDGEGRHLLTAGAQGGGPGEFESIWWIEAVGADSVLAYDSRQRRISTFDPAGRFVGSRTLQSTAETGSLNAVGRFADGSFLLQRRFGFGPESIQAGLWRIPSVLYRSSGAGAPFDSLGTFPWTEGMVFIGDNFVNIYAMPYAHNSVLALHTDRFYIGTQDGYEIEVHPNTGGPGRRIRWSGRDLVLTPELIDRFRREWVAEAETEDQRRSREERFDDMEFPDLVPAYDDIVVDAAGDLWVEQFRRPGEEANRWNVFDPEGRLLGVVELPPGLDVYQIGPDFVLGRWRDELDVEHVRLYELVKPAL